MVFVCRVMMTFAGQVIETTGESTTSSDKHIEVIDRQVTLTVKKEMKLMKSLIKCKSYWHRNTITYNK